MKKIEISFEKKSSIKICGLQFGVEDSLSTIDSIHVKTEKKKRGNKIAAHRFDSSVNKLDCTLN